MNLSKPFLAAFSISIISAIIFGLIAFLVSAGDVARFDMAIISFVQGFESPILTSLMKGFTWLGTGYGVTIMVIIVSLILFVFLKHRTELIFFIVVVVGSSLIDELLKSLFHRDRPSLHRIIEASGFSFPSGHSMTAVAFYSSLAFLLWRHIPSRLGRGVLIFFSVGFILMIGVSRIYLGVHYPSDVIGGYFASGCWVASSIWFYQWYREKSYEKRVKK